MLRSLDGRVIHRDGCKRAGNAVRWHWADGMTDGEVIVAMLAYDHLQAARCCFGASKEELAAAMAQAEARP